MSKLVDVIYCRVSTDDQISNTSLPDQESRCRDYLERLGLDNVVVFKDDYSGFEFNRPELSKILDLMRQGKVRSFTSLRVDRICRKTSILEILRESYFKPLGIEVHTLDLMQWQWTAAHESIQDNLCLMGSFWGKILVEVLQNGRKKHVLNGNVITAGHSPLGLREVVDFDTKGKRTGAHFEFNECETPIVFRIFGDFVDDNLSLSRLANRLNSDKVPTYTQLRELTPFKAKQAEKSKSPHQWRSSTIRQILRNPVYDGRWYFGKTRTISKILDNGDKLKKKVRTDQNLIEVTFPALIPSDVWQAAQARLDKNREEKRGRQPKHEYLLSKRITCECGYKMTASSKEQGKYLYYRCPAVNEKDSTCHIGYVNARLVDAIAWGWLYKLLSDRNELKNRIDNYVEEKRKTLAPVYDRLVFIAKSLEKKHATHEVMLGSLFKLPELAQAKTLTLITQTEAEIKEYEQERGELESQIEQQEATVRALEVWQQHYRGYGVMGDSFAEFYAKCADEAREGGLINHADVDYWQLARIAKEKGITFEDKLRHFNDFDLRVIILSDTKMHISCKVGSDVLPLLDITGLDSVQKKPQFLISFADVLRLDHLTTVV